MPKFLKGQQYYSTSEVCNKAGISRSTLSRWIQKGILAKTYKDRRGWRLYTEADLGRITAEANKVQVIG